MNLSFIGWHFLEESHLAQARQNPQGESVGPSIHRFASAQQCEKTCTYSQITASILSNVVLRQSSIQASFQGCQKNNLCINPKPASHKTPEPTPQQTQPRPWQSKPRPCKTFFCHTMFSILCDVGVLCDLGILRDCRRSAEIAAERRKNAAHGASHGKASGKTLAPAGAKDKGATTLDALRDINKM